MTILAYHGMGISGATKNCTSSVLNEMSEARSKFILEENSWLQVAEAKDGRIPRLRMTGIRKSY